MIRYPNIIGKNDSQKLEQMKSYLHQLADELNFQLDKTGNIGSGYPSSAVDGSAVAKPVKKDDAISNFNDIKALIIKSADIVDAYYQEINKKLEGQYVAESDFGVYKEKTQLQLTASSNRIDSVVEKQEEIDTDLVDLERTLRSEIEQTADSIKLEVTGGEPGKTASIKLTVGDNVYSGEIDMTGLVTFSNLTDGTTEISGDNIKTGRILAEYIDVTNLIVSKLYALDGNGSGITLDVLGLKRTSADKLNPLIELHHDWVQTGGFLEERPYIDLFKTFFDRDVNPGVLTGGITDGVHLDADGIEFRTNIGNFTDYPVHSYDHTVDFGISRYGDVTGHLKVDAPTANNHVVNKQYVDTGLATKYSLGAVSGGRLPSGANLNDYITPGQWSCPTNVLASSLVNGAGLGAGRLVVEYSNGEDTTYILQTWVAHTGDNAYRLGSNSGASWGAWVNCSPSAFAPAGFGLGTTGKVKTISALSDLDTIVSNGWYTIYSPEVLYLSGVAFHSITLEVSMYNTAQGYQIVRFLGNNIVCKRAMYSSEWREWEFDNPPMETGVEYRTTERYMGKPVYIKMVNLGNLPNSTIKDIAYHGSTSVTPISMNYQLGSDYTNFYTTGVTDVHISCVNYNYLRITCTHDRSGLVARAIVKYIYR